VSWHEFTVRDAVHADCTTFETIAMLGLLDLTARLNGNRWFHLYVAKKGAAGRVLSRSSTK
jgi:hypothetical protein